MLLSCQNISKEFVTGPVLQKVSFHIEDNEKAAIVGINGAGKTTLLRIIMGELEPEEGIVTIARDKTVGYLAQNDAVDTDNTIYEELLSVKQNILNLEKEIRDCEEQMNHLSGAELDALMNRYTSLTHSFELQNGYAYQSELGGVLKGLGFTEADYQKSIATLSGGQKTRVALGKMLLQAPDLIILDEPTNHLDMNSIRWLETYLLNYKGAVLIVSHDRYFLDRIASKIIELDMGKSTMFTGNYSDYAVKKEQLREAQLKAYLNQQREIKHQEAVIEKLKSFNREKSIKRAESREKMLDKVERLDKPVEENTDMKLTLTPHMVSGKDVLTIEELSKSYGPLTLFKDVNIEIKRGEHVAIIGDNGTGKTTLLKILNEMEKADHGTFTLGAKVEIGYYDQEHHVLHADKTLYDEIADDYPYLTITEIRNTLASFLFTGEDVFKRIKDLSGGERGRVSLAKLMLSDCNFLILDEPTNHLDIQSKEILEDAINRYEGTVLYVSHDRYFINKTATRILELTGQNFLNYIGNYEYYLEKHDDVVAAAVQSGLISSSVLNSNIATINRAAANTAASTSAAQNSTSPTGTSGAASTGTNASVGGAGAGLAANAGVGIGSGVTNSSSDGALDWKAQKELQAKLRKKENDLKKCEDEIAKLEAEMEELNTQLSDPAIAANSVKLQEITEKQSVIENKLTDLYEKWEELAE